MKQEEKRIEAEKMPAAVSADKSLKISVLIDTGDDNLVLEKIKQREQLKR